MRVLLDECLPRRLKQHLSGHDVKTAPEAGWAGRKNGELLGLASGNFDAFITIDRRFASGHRLDDLTFGIVMLQARSNRITDLQALVPGILDALRTIQPGQVVRVAGY